MKAFTEKSDLILRSLISSGLSWDEFTQVTKMRKSDGLLIFLKEKKFIDYSVSEIRLTDTGRNFISITSFEEQRSQHA